MFVLENQISIFIIIFLYNAFIQKMIEYIYEDCDQIEKIQNSAQMLFIIGCFSIIIFKWHLNNKKNKKNKKINIIYTGLYYGNIILILFSSLNNWSFLTDQNKLLMFGLSLCIFLLYVYHFDLIYDSHVEDD